MIAKIGIIEAIAAQYSVAHAVPLIDEMGLLPMTDALFDEISSSQQSEDIVGFILMTVDLEKEILKLCPIGMVAYIEADSFGGQGLQSAIVWENGRRSEIHSSTKNAINVALKRLGISGTNGKDEFDCLNLRKHRDTYDWIKS